MVIWRPWTSSLQARKFEVKLVVRRIEGLPAPAPARSAVEVRWKGHRKAMRSLILGGSRRNLTREEALAGGDAGDEVVVWDEEFRAECGLVVSKGKFQSWEILFTVLSIGANEKPKNEPSKVGVASLDLAEYASSAVEKEVEIIAPLLCPVSNGSSPTLYLALRLMELKTIPELPNAVRRSVSLIPYLPSSDNSLYFEKDENSAARAGFRKMKLFKSLILNGKARRTGLSVRGSEGHYPKTDGGELTFSWDTDSTNNDLDGEVEDDNDVSKFRKSFNYGSLSSANYVGGSLNLDTVLSAKSDELIYYSHRRSDVGFLSQDETYSPMSERSVSQILKRRIFSWRKRNLSFRSPKFKGKPLLNKSYGEDGGDDIDFDRRQFSSSDGTIFMLWNGFGDFAANGNFGDDYFAVGSWESKEIVSRDGNMKLNTEVFFASIDQMSERAAGESACAVLVAIIADWFHANQGMMPTKSELDTLIREGSLEWRKLCENSVFRERFPDKHFDLDTVLEANIRPISFDSGKSFIGFFSPGNTYGDDSFDYLHGAMSFDTIWDEIDKTRLNIVEDIHQLYIISWNDHFFILKVDRDAYYIVDTLGERLHEGCNQAYILKFDDNTTIYNVPNEGELASRKVQEADNQQSLLNKGNAEGRSAQDLEDGNLSAKEELMCKGKDSCKEYIKNFLAAIPIRELQVDIQKGLLTSTSVHHRLQIEFHSTKLYKEMEDETATKFSRTVVDSDSEFSLTTESDPEISSSPKPFDKFSWEVNAIGEFSWPPEPVKEAAATFLFAPAMSLEVGVN